MNEMNSHALKIRRGKSQYFNNVIINYFPSPSQHGLLSNPGSISADRAVICKENIFSLEKET